MKQGRREKTSRSKTPPRNAPREAVGLRIIGGEFRGRKLLYSGDLRTRPMKDRLREVVFNLIGDCVRGKQAIDLFAGTGALGFEALSRGAQHATLIEQHHPTAAIIRQNAATLGVEQRVEILAANTFIWHRRGLPSPEPAWIVFCSPPYEFYANRTAEMLELIGGLFEAAPTESLFVVEADHRFDFKTLPQPHVWDIRAYPPAIIAIGRKQ